MFTDICFIVAIVSLILALYSAIKAHGYKTRLDPDRSLLPPLIATYSAGRDTSTRWNR